MTFSFQGVSNTSYKHSTESPVYGSGQGSGNAGTEWNYISIPLMTKLEQWSQGCTITGPDKTQWNKTIIAFVDDTKQFNNQFSSFESTLDNILHDAKQWSSLLNMSGGAVNFEKCHHIIMQWATDKHGLMYITDPDLPDLMIRDENDTSHTIKRLSVHDK